MGVALRYWMLVIIDTTGKRQVKEIAPAREFFVDTFSINTVEDDVRDAEIQQMLLQLWKNAPVDRCFLAERCLLCFISWQIEQVCLQLEINFGRANNFSCADLLPYVLDDDGKLQSASAYQCLSRQILQSFDSTQSSLTSWTNIRVKQHQPLTQFLLESGVYLISDWAILNDTRPKQLERILSEFHSLTSTEITYLCRLLASYHLVYRTQRLQQRSLGIKGKCPPPTTEQLQQIAVNIQSQTGQRLMDETVMIQLQNLATLLRQYRIHIRGGSLPTKSLDAVDSDTINNLAAATSQDNEDVQTEFLELYRPQFLAALKEALILVIESRLKNIKAKKIDKAKQFLIALQLVYCQQMPMTEIAKRLGLRAQDAVTRLLQLKEFRADVQQQLLRILRDRVLNLAQNYFHIESLSNLENQIYSALNEQVTRLIREAEIQAQTPRDKVQNSLFADQVCRYLDTINE